MTEPINLAPMQVHAVSVPVRRPHNSIAGPDEMMLQLGENGGVQVDVFGRDAQGNELHESREMQEDEYEEMRKGYLRAELATMPPFSSFKSGNTIGRVVGETAPSAVPASQANPPIEAETEEEGITGEQILDGIQLGLDVVGLIPVVGEVADIASGVISLFRGDYVGAGLSLLSAIPFVGYAGTAGKAARYGTKMAEASGKVGKEIVEKATQEAGERARREALERISRDRIDTPRPPGGKIEQPPVRPKTKPRKPREPRKYEKKVVNEDGSVTYTLKTKSGSNVDVTYKNGYPDFSAHKYNGSSGRSEVTIDMAGDKTDFARANKEAGFGEAQYSHPDGYTWHHHENQKTMQLIKTDVHDAAPHTGGASSARNSREKK